MKDQIKHLWIFLLLIVLWGNASPTKAAAVPIGDDSGSPCFSSVEGPHDALIDMRTFSPLNNVRTEPIEQQSSGRYYVYGKRVGLLSSPMAALQQWSERRTLDFLGKGTCPTRFYYVIALRHLLC